MKNSYVFRLLAGVLCATLITQNLGFVSTASEPDSAVVQELKGETEPEEESATSEEDSAEDEDVTEEKTEKAELDSAETSEREEVPAEEDSEEPEETDGPEIFEGRPVKQQSAMRMT